jgi:hypothetical protein
LAIAAVSVKDNAHATEFVLMFSMVIPEMNTRVPDIISVFGNDDVIFKLLVEAVN